MAPYVQFSNNTEMARYATIDHNLQYGGVDKRGFNLPHIRSSQEYIQQANKLRVSEQVSRNRKKKVDRSF